MGQNRPASSVVPVKKNSGSSGPLAPTLRARVRGFLFGLPILEVIFAID